MQRLSLPPNAQWCSGVASVLPWYSHNLSETWKPVYRNFIGWLPFNGILYCTRYPVPSSAHFILSDLQRRWCSATTRQQNQESLCHIHLGWPDLKRGVPVLRFRMVPWTEPNPFQSTKPWQCKWIVRSMYFICSIVTSRKENNVKTIQKVHSISRYTVYLLVWGLSRLSKGAFWIERWTS